ncbi:MAG TPA: hypothetical protein V6C71_10830 [Coleofasciculaceae cyanobacterium]|jgi:hypothetical protein
MISPKGLAPTSRPSRPTRMGIPVAIASAVVLLNITNKTRLRLIDNLYRFLPLCFIVSG